MNLYDYRATDTVNLVADKAMDFINAHLREAPEKPLDMRQVCLWSVDAVAPRVSWREKAGLAREASAVIQDAMALHGMVLALRRTAA